jgi:hypothetical protein
MISFNSFFRCTLTIVCFVSLAGFSYGQSKKEQIANLSRRLDSLQVVNSSQLSLINQSSMRIYELNNNLSDLNNNIKELQKQRQDRISEIKLQKTEIQKLKSEIKSKADSIFLLTWDRPYLHPINSSNLSNGENKFRAIDEVLNYLGEYQSADACTLEMPRFTDKVGPTMSISISASNDFRNSIEGERKNNYYLVFNFCGSYSGQFEENNENLVSTEIIDFQQEGEIVKMTLRTSGCAEYYSMNPEKRQVQKMLNNTFTLSMKFLANGKVIMSTGNAPELCHHDWGFENVTFYPLVWSR